MEILSIDIAWRNISHVRGAMDGNSNFWRFGMMGGHVAAYYSQPLGLEVGVDRRIQFARGVDVVHTRGTHIIVNSEAVGRGAGV